MPKKPIKRAGRTDVNTVNDQPNVVDLDAAAHQRKVHAEKLRALLEEGEADIRAGRTRPMEEFLKEFGRAKS